MTVARRTKGRLVSANDLARYCDVDLKTIHNWESRGKIAGIRTSPDNRFTYHPQTVALLQWFARASPSNAIADVYSFPDETALTRPADCLP